METATEALSQYEIERGKPMPSKLHAFIQARLVTELSNRYQERYSSLSELSLELSTGRATPDIAIYPPMEIDFFHDEIRMTEPPLCAIEILSPTQGIHEILARAPKYFAGGVQSFWVVIPPFKTIYVFSDAETYDTFADKAVLHDKKTGIELPLTEIFPTN